jgi:hypothetical protein
VARTVVSSAKVAMVVVGEVVEMGSGAMIYMPNLIKIGTKCFTIYKGETNTETAW